MNPLAHNTINLLGNKSIQLNSKYQIIHKITKNTYKESLKSVGILLEIFNLFTFNHYDIGYEANDKYMSEILLKR